jgi:hypothetical protein
MVEHADVVVIEMGPSGEDVAEGLAEAGRDVVGSRSNWSAASAPTGDAYRPR